MKYLEAILRFLTTIAQLCFRGKRKHIPDRPLVDDPGHAGSEQPQHRSGPGGYRSDSLDISETFPSPEKIMGGALILCATGGYLLKLLGS